MKKDSTVYRMPRGMMVDINKVPDDFDEKIREAFREYTTGTSRDYTYHDKLLFIDNCVRAFHGNISEEEAARLNIDKLRARYPDGFDTERSIHRDLDDI